MLELKNINKYYNAGTVNEMCLFKDFNLSIADGEFVSVIGSNGSGKTSMLNLICGSIPVDSGTIVMGGTDITKMPEYKRQRRIGRVYQHPAMGTCPNMTILENMALADNKGKPFNLLPGTNKARIDFYRDQLKILGLGLEDKMGVKVGVLSGGQRQAMALLMSTMTPIEFLILDEPTNHLDITSKEILESALNQYTGTVFFVSHDRYFINQTATRILELTGETVVNYIGNYDYYLEKHDIMTQLYVKPQEISDIQAGKQDDAVNKLDWQAQKAEQARIRKIENSLKKIEDEIAALEEEISAIDEECAKPENAVNSAKLNELAARQQECRERLETCYETWEDLSMQLDGAKDS